MDRASGEHDEKGPTMGKNLKPGDLVLVWDAARKNQKSRKLDARWKGPRIVVSVNASGTTARVRELHGVKVKKYHVNDLRVYLQRDSIMSTDGKGNVIVKPIWPPALEVDRGANAYAGYPGQRAFYLMDY
jgi:hypothetical protein